MNLNAKKSVEFAVSCPVAAKLSQCGPCTGRPLVPFGSLTGLQIGDFRSGTWGNWRSVSTDV